MMLRITVLVCLIRCCCGLGSCHLDKGEPIQGPVKQLVGSSFKITCSVGQQDEGKSSNLTFRISGDIGTTVEWHEGLSKFLLVQNASLFNGSVDCVLNGSMSEEVCHIDVRVGYEPQKLIYFDCVARDWKKKIMRVCEWEAPENTFPTKYMAHLDSGDEIGEIELEEKLCPNSLRYCLNSTIKYFRHLGNTTFKILGSNELKSKVTVGTYCVDFSMQAIPGKPQVFIQTINPKTAQVSWKANELWKYVPYPYEYNVAFKKLGDPLETQEIIRMENCSRDDNCHHYKFREKIAGLSANSVYTFAVRSRFRRNTDERMWSEAAVEQLKTESLKLCEPPKIFQDSFQILHQKGGVRDVVIYWEPFPCAEEETGKKYYIIRVSDRGSNMSKTVSKSYAKFENLNDETGYTFLINYESDVSRSSGPGKVILPKKSELLHHDLLNAHLIKYNKYNGVLLWNMTQHLEEVYVDVYTCDNLQANVCEDTLKRHPVRQNDTAMNISNSYAGVFLRLSSGEKNSGMMLVTCKVDKGSDEAPEYLYALEVTNTTVRVAWNESYKLSGDLDHFIIYYNNDAVQTKLQNPPGAKPHALLEGLQSYTTYRIELKACTCVSCSNKSQSILNVTTHIGVPGRMHQPNVTLVKPNVVHIAWKKPQEPGGPIDRYDIVADNGTYNWTCEGSMEEITFPFCTDSKDAEYNFRIRAVSIDKQQHARLYEGPWSEYVNLRCSPENGLSVNMVASIAGGVAAGVLLCIFLVRLGYLPIRKKMRKWSGVHPNLPKGMMSELYEINSARLPDGHNASEVDSFGLTNVTHIGHSEIIYPEEDSSLMLDYEDMNDGFVEQHIFTSVPSSSWGWIYKPQDADEQEELLNSPYMKAGIQPSDDTVGFTVSSSSNEQISDCESSACETTSDPSGMEEPSGSQVPNSMVYVPLDHPMVSPSSDSQPCYTKAGIAPDCSMDTGSDSDSERWIEFTSPAKKDKGHRNINPQSPPVIAAHIISTPTYLPLENFSLPQAASHNENGNDMEMFNLSYVRAEIAATNSHGSV